MSHSPINLAQRLREARIVAVVTVEEVNAVAALADALRWGGIWAVELTLRTPAALEALRAMRTAAPGFLLGAGTVLTVEQADAVKAAGADFALAPGFDATTVRHCTTIGLPFVPGVATASEIQAAIGVGARVLKFFPAEPLGGASGLRALATPFAHLNLEFVPLGGIDLAKASAYLAEPVVAAIGGSWIATPALTRKGAWDEIAENAKAAIALCGGRTAS